jgi:hypothetical protein
MVIVRLGEQTWHQNGMHRPATDLKYPKKGARAMEDEQKVDEVEGYFQIPTVQVDRPLPLLVQPEINPQPLPPGHTVTDPL